MSFRSTDVWKNEFWSGEPWIEEPWNQCNERNEWNEWNSKQWKCPETWKGEKDDGWHADGKEMREWQRDQGGEGHKGRGKGNPSLIPYNQTTNRRPSYRDWHEKGGEQHKSSSKGKGKRTGKGDRWRDRGSAIGSWDQEWYDEVGEETDETRKGHGKAEPWWMWTQWDRDGKGTEGSWQEGWHGQGKGNRWQDWQVRKGESAWWVEEKERHEARGTPCDPWQGSHARTPCKEEWEDHQHHESGHKGYMIRPGLLHPSAHFSTPKIP